MWYTIKSTVTYCFNQILILMEYVFVLAFEFQIRNSPELLFITCLFYYKDNYQK